LPRAWGRGFESHRPLQTTTGQTISTEFLTDKKARFRAVLRVRLEVLNPERYGNLSLNAGLSPKLEGWPIYSTSFFWQHFQIINLIAQSEDRHPFVLVVMSSKAQTN
jgi:hypothetical protein